MTNKENEIMLEKSGIKKFHDAGFKGEGIKIGIMESFGSDHYNGVVKACKIFAPNATYVDMNEVSDYANFVKCIREGVDIVNKSQMYMNLQGSKEFVAQGGIIFGATGNNKNLADFSGWEHVIDVGAVWETMQVANFSTKSDTLDISFFVPYIQNDEGGWHQPIGTSFSSPALTGANACFLQRLKSLNKVYTPEIIKQYLYVKALDLGEKGKDRSYGIGLATFDFDVSMFADKIVVPVKPVDPTPTIPEVKPTPEIPSKPIQNTNKDCLLILDDGHGLDTSGKRTPIFSDGSVVLENVFNSAVVNYISKLCNVKGIQYQLTAPELNDVSLAERVSREKKFRKDFLTVNPKGKTAFVSIHYNAHKETWDESTASGVETWYSEGSTEGKKMAELVHSELIKGTKQVNRGIKPVSDFYILKNTISPAILIEGGFMDDLTEAKLMTNPKFHKEVALEIFNGMMLYWGLPTAGYVDFEVTVTQPSIPPVTTIDSNLKLVKSRFKSSDIFHVEIPMSEYWIYPTLGTKGKLEKLSSIVDGFEKRVGVDVKVAWNAGFFNLNGSSEHLGNFIINFGKEPVYQYAQSPSFIDFISYKNGDFECRQNSMKKEDVILLQPKINFLVGCSYSLVIDGKINIINADKFSHSKQDNPRTMVGWNKVNNTFIVAVVDGRKVGSVGLTAVEQAEYMLKLGCTVAVNFDGGGSTELIFDNGADRDLIANIPSDKVERKIGSSMVVYKK